MGFSLLKSAGSCAVAENIALDTFGVNRNLRTSYFDSFVPFRWQIWVRVRSANRTAEPGEERLLRTQRNQRQALARTQAAMGRALTSDGRTLRKTGVPAATISRSLANDGTRADERRAHAANEPRPEANDQPSACQRRAHACKRSDDVANAARTPAPSASPVPFATHHPARACDRTTFAARTPRLSKQGPSVVSGRRAFATARAFICNDVGAFAPAGSS